MRLWIPALAAAIALPAYVAPAFAESYTGVVTEVLDVANLVVTINGTNQAVKLIGVAPASYGAVNWTQQGRDYARSLLLGRTLQLETDYQARDTQGRLLAWAFLGGTLVNQELVRQGMAVAVPDSFNVRYAGNLLNAQQEAARAGVGVWNARNHLPSPTPYPTPTPTWTPTPVPTWTPSPTWTPTPRPSFSSSVPPSTKGLKHDHGKKKGKGHQKGKGKGHEKHGD